MILKYYEEFHSIKTFSKLLNHFTSVITLYMPGHRLTSSQYAHQKNLEHFGNHIVQLEEQSFTHISQVV